jgi:hypothetical protein
MAYPTVDLVLVCFVLLLDHKYRMIEQEEQQFAVVALRAPAALKWTLEYHLTTFFSQPQILTTHMNKLQGDKEERTHHLLAGAVHELLFQLQ